MTETEKEIIRQNSFNEVRCNLPYIWSKYKNFALYLILSDEKNSYIAILYNINFLWENDKVFLKSIINRYARNRYLAVELYLEFLWENDEPYARELVKDNDAAILHIKFLFRVDKKLALRVAINNRHSSSLIENVYYFQYVCPELYYLIILVNREYIKEHHYYLYCKFKHILEK